MQVCWTMDEMRTYELSSSNNCDSSELLLAFKHWPVAQPLPAPRHCSGQPSSRASWAHDSLQKQRFITYTNQRKLKKVQQREITALCPHCLLLESFSLTRWQCSAWQCYTCGSCVSCTCRYVWRARHPIQHDSAAFLFWAMVAKAKRIEGKGEQFKRHHIIPVS